MNVDSNICVKSNINFLHIANLWKIGTIGITPEKVIGHEEECVLDVCGTVKDNNG